jgi:hypothetical protein
VLKLDTGKKKGSAALPANPKKEEEKRKKNRNRVSFESQGLVPCTFYFIGTFLWMPFF